MANDYEYKPKQEDFAYKCPCCGYPTLPERGGYNICTLCGWEDDGQNDPYADEVWGGPNKHLSLTEARMNFKLYWDKFSPDNDTRLINGDSEVELAAKKAIASAFDAMETATETEREQLWQIVLNGEATLYWELHHRLREWERQQREKAVSGKTGLEEGD